MRPNALTGILFFLHLAVLAPVASAETVEARVRAVTDAAPAPFGLATRSVPLTEGGPEGGAGLAPEDCLDPRTSSFELAGARILIVVGRAAPDSALPDLLALDANGDGTLAPDERHSFRPWKRTVRGVEAFGGAVSGIEIRIGERTFPIDVGWRVSPGGGVVGVRGRWVLETEVERGDKRFLVVMRDGDLDGTFEGDADAWAVFPGKAPVRPLDPLSLNGLGLGGWSDGHRFVVVKGTWADRAKIELSVEPAAAPDEDDRHEARERIAAFWSRRLEPQRAEFVQAYLLDPERPKTSEPVRWEGRSFERALEDLKTKRAIRPILVDLRAFWCEWAYRYDLFTYGDKEVADLLRLGFTRVRIIEEQADPAEFRKLREQIARRGLPALGIWDTDGELIHLIQGWRKPRDLVRELHGALEYIRAKRAAEVK